MGPPRPDRDRRAALVLRHLHLVPQPQELPAVRDRRQLRRRAALESERWLFFGNDPAEFLHNLLGTGHHRRVPLGRLPRVPHLRADLARHRAHLVEPPARRGHLRERALDLLDPRRALLLHDPRARPGLRRPAGLRGPARHRRRAASGDPARAPPRGPGRSRARPTPSSRIAAFASLHTGVLVRRGADRAPRPRRIAPSATACGRCSASPSSRPSTSAGTTSSTTSPASSSASSPCWAPSG